MYDLHKLIFFMIIWIVFRFIMDNLRLLKYIEGNRSYQKHYMGSNRFSNYGPKISITNYDQSLSPNPYCVNNPKLCN